MLIALPALQCQPFLIIIIIIIIHIYIKCDQEQKKKALPINGREPLFVLFICRNNTADKLFICLKCLFFI